MVMAVWYLRGRFGDPPPSGLKGPDAELAAADPMQVGCIFASPASEAAGPRGPAALPLSAVSAADLAVERLRAGQRTFPDSSNAAAHCRRALSLTRSSDDSLPSITTGWDSKIYERLRSGAHLRWANRNGRSAGPIADIHFLGADLEPSSLLWAPLRYPRSAQRQSTMKALAAHCCLRAARRLSVLRPHPALPPQTGSW